VRTIHIDISSSRSPFLSGYQRTSRYARKSPGGLVRGSRTTSCIEARATLSPAQVPRARLRRVGREEQRGARRRILQAHGDYHKERKPAPAARHQVACAWARTGRRGCCRRLAAKPTSSLLPVVGIGFSEQTGDYVTVNPREESVSGSAVQACASELRSTAQQMEYRGAPVMGRRWYRKEVVSGREQGTGDSGPMRALRCLKSGNTF
jgi:hypothetical protein